MDRIRWKWQTTLQEKIKEILDKYPDDGQILKEIIQNAEDAKATCVKFLYDKNSYTTEGLQDEDQAKYQGQALYAYNDAVFKNGEPGDFENLISIGKSFKKDDRTKVGRFGQGFKSVYHMTEMPTVLSGEYIAKISPYEETVLKGKHSLVDNQYPAELDSFRGEWKGYGKDEAETGWYKGTLFRFPLRKKESEISKTIYDEEKVKALFHSLQNRAYMNLLFLKSLKTIEVYVQELNESEPTLLFRINLKATKDDQSKRIQFFEDLSTGDGGLKVDESFFTYQVEIETHVAGPLASEESRKFLVCHYYNAKDCSDTLTDLLKSEQLSYLPLVGVAMPLTLDAAHNIGRPDGHIFCFLPLPVHGDTSPTGLPVHVNSFFVVSEDRSEVKWPTAGQDSKQMSDRLKWNQCLVQELIPRAYAHMLREATSLGDVQPSDIYHAFPDPDKVDDKWKSNFLPVFLNQAFALPLLPTVGHDRNRFVSVGDAVLCLPNVEGETRTAMIRLLTECEMNVLCLPDHMMTAVRSCGLDVRVATPMFVCQAMKKHNVYRSFSCQEKLELLNYILMSDAPVSLVDIQGLELLPLSDGNFAVFKSSSASGNERIYVVSKDHQRLLPSLEHRFLSNDIENAMHGKLTGHDMQGYTQLVHCTEDDILTLLPRIFPQATQDSAIIDCSKKEFEHLNEVWLQSLWQFLSSLSDTHPTHLEKVKHLHILQLPAGELTLGRLTGGKVYLAKHLHDETLPESVADAVRHFNITILDQLPEFVKRHPHVFDKHFIFQPNPRSVMLALVQACGDLRVSDSGYKNFNSNASPEQRHALLQFLEPLRSEEADDTWKSLLRELYLFETFDMSGNSPRHFTSVAKVRNGMTSYTLPTPSPCELLDVTSSDVQLMSEYIGIKTLTETDLIEGDLFCSIQKREVNGSDVEKVMVYVLSNLVTHERRSHTFHRTISELAFLEDKKGEFRRASDYFDPNCNILKSLFHGEDMFPPSAYDDVLDTLRKIGLKGIGSVTGNEVLASAQYVSDHAPGSVGGMPSSQLQDKSRGIGEIIQAGVVLGDDIREKLRHIAWLPIQIERPAYPMSLPWGGWREYEAPECQCLSLQIPLVGSSMPSPKTSVVPDTVLQALCGERQPPLPKIVEQLQFIVKVYNAEEKVSLLGFVMKIYDALRKYPVHHEVQQVLSAHGLLEWIWQGSGFTTIDCVALRHSGNWEPYTFALPDELQSMRQWLQQMGAKEDVDFVKTLHRIKKWHEENDSSSERIQRDLAIVRQLLIRIKSLDPKDLPDNIKDAALVPVENPEGQLMLLSASECTYSEESWGLTELAQLDANDGNEIKYLHGSIEKDVAEFFGVRTTISRLLEGDSGGTPIVESHGQEERLTHRLKMLLQDYPDGLAIPKELIQNADDAGASVVKFLYDERGNLDAMDGLLDEGMKECQGPALWVYNDAVFSKDDLENISKLSGATKGHQTDKIGKFGLGFNVVYNITDVPSFITGESIVFFDPHKSHLGKARVKQDDAGLKINILSGSKKSTLIMNKYYNQFRTYNGVFGCKTERTGVQQPFKGTLFRLPLRRPDSKSEINSMPYTRDEVQELFQLIINQASSLLLFTQCVNSLEVYHLSEFQNDPSQAEMVFNLNVETARRLTSLPKIEEKEDNLLRLASDLAKKTSSNLQPSRASILCTSLDITGHGKLKLQGSPRVDHWLVYDCIGTKASMDLAREIKPTSYVPVAGAGILLEKDGENYHLADREDSSDRVFCHLPLPSSVRSGLPLIVNGNFAIRPDRRQIVQLTSDDKDHNTMNVWNETLKKDAISEAYLGALMWIKEVVKIGYDPFSLWPDSRCIDRSFNSVRAGFFDILATASPPPTIFTNGNDWFDYAHAVFLDETLASSSHRDLALNQLQRYLDRCNSARKRLIATTLPCHVKDGLTKYKIEDKIYTCADVYGKAILPYLDEMSRDDRDKSTLFALKESKKDDRLKELLMNHACIPVRPDGNKRVKIDQLLSPKGRMANLYKESDGVFPMPCYCDDKTLLILKELGMNTNDISWSKVKERAESVKDVRGADRHERLKHWMSYVDQKLVLSGRDCPTSDLCTIRFLPVLGKLVDFPVEWKGDGHNERLVSPSEVFQERHKNIIGSSHFILDESRCGLRQYSYNTLSKVIGILGLAEKKPPLDDVIRQLKLICSSHVQANTPSIRDICKDIYRHLDTCCKDTHDVLKINQELLNVQCIHEDGMFMYPRHCAKRGNSVPGYLHRLTSYYSYPALFDILGVKDEFHATDYIGALKRVVPGKTDVKTVREIVEKLHSWLDQKKTSLDRLELAEDQQVLLPSEVGNTGVWQLLPVEKLCLNAAGSYNEDIMHREWLAHSVGEQKFQYVHPDIPLRIAQAFGVKSDRDNVLGSLGSGMPFGQGEPLSRRIKNILDSYPTDKHDKSVLKELLQNADDAGATELRFILDKRTHPKEKVLNHNWKQLQGPALCVYNNSPFTEKDLKGICSLGQGAKSDDPTTTGQYGIGFNSVYRLTDVPTFVTEGKEIGPTFAILDPNLRHAPFATVEKPGRIYQGKDFEKVHRDFGDVFSGFLEDRFDRRGATLFRLPLRSSEMARNSDIVDHNIAKAVNVNDAEQVLKSFEKDLFRCLLFVNSVRSITLEHVGDNKPSYSVHVSMSAKDEESLEKFNRYVKQVGKELNARRKAMQDKGYRDQAQLNGFETYVKQVEYREIVYTLYMQDSNGQKQTWSICQCIGYSQCTISNEIMQALVSGELALLPRGGAAILLESTSEVKERGMFCFLPLPSQEDHKLPIHINGHFALDSSRRSLWVVDKTKGFKGMWNSFIMEHVVAEAYVSLIANRCSKLKETGATMDDFKTLYKMFPDRSGVKSYLVDLVDGFYHAAHRRQLECLAVQVTVGESTETRWFTIAQSMKGEAFFDDLSPAYITKRVPNTKPQIGYRTMFRPPVPKEDIKIEKDEVHSLTNILCRLGFNLLCAPIFIYMSLRGVNDLKVCKVEPKTVLDYLYNYKKYKDCTLKYLPQQVEQSPYLDVDSVVTLIKYCFNKMEKKDIKPLVGLPLCVSDDGMLQEFSGRPLFYPEFAKLAPDHRHLFVKNDVFYAAPLNARKKEPLALVDITIKDLAGLLLPSKQYLARSNRIEWNPSQDKALREWILTLWSFVNREVDAVYTDAKHKKEEVALTRLEPLNAFCIIPAYDSHQCKHFLYRLDRANWLMLGGVIARGTLSDASLPNILAEAGIPSLHKPNLPETMHCVTVPDHMVSNAQNRRGILKALWSCQEIDAERLRLVASNKTNADKLLDYFTTFFKNECTSDEAAHLRELPIHKLVNGTVSPLNFQCQGCYLVPQGIPKAGLDNWYSKGTHEQFIFQTGTDVDALYKRLGTFRMNAVDLYVQLILNKVNFGQFLTKEEQLEHLDYIRTMIIPFLKETSDPYKALLALLQSLPFLETSTGTLLQAKDFYDPRVPLFAAMETQFPPKQFRDDAHLEFLKLCGLKSVVTREDIIRYAARVETEGKTGTPVEKIEEKAKVICAELKFQEESTLRELKHIEFVPIGRVRQKYTDMHRQHCLGDPEKTVFICFQNSVLHNQHVVCWTSAKVLPAWMDHHLLPSTGGIPPLRKSLPPDTLKAALGIQHPVSMATVVDHCSNLTTHLSRLNQRHSKPEDIENTMHIIYDYLTTRIKKEGPGQLKRLENVPCIWLHDAISFVLPQQVALSLSKVDEIPPYLYRLPNTLWKYMDVLKHTGVENEPDQRHYMLVLKMIKEEMGDIGLDADPNKLMAAQKAIMQSMRHLSGEKQTKCDQPLYLLSRRKSLEVSTDLYQIRSSWDHRIKTTEFPYPILYIPEIDSLQFFKYLRKIPMRLRPKDLSDVVVEVIDEECVQGIAPQDVGTPNWFQTRIASEEFKTELERLLANDALNQEYVDYFEQYWNELERKLVRIQFVFVDKLSTVLKHRDGEGGIIPGSSSGSQNVLIKTTEAGSVVYLLKGQVHETRVSARDKDEYTGLLKKIIGESFPELERETSYRLKDLFTSGISEIKALFDSYGLSQARTGRRKQPLLGDFVPLNRHCLLASDFLHFRDGEYIAYELDDPLNKGEEGQATYIYGKVVKDLEETKPDQGVRKYEIDIGEKKIQVLSTSMYKLSRSGLLNKEECPVNQDYDLDSIKRQLSTDIDYVHYQSSVEERNRLIKRLVMKWQSGSHPQHQDTARAVLSFIDEKVAKLERDDNLIATASGQSPVPTRWFGVDCISKYVIRRTEENSREILRQREWLDSNSQALHALEDPSDFSYFRCYGSNPQPGEAERWYRQAAKDLQASSNDHQGSNDAYEWALYKCHQAAEKALKAAYMTQDSTRYMSHDLQSMAELVGDSSLKKLAEDITNELGDGMKLRYPDRLVSPRIPHDLYDEATCIRIHGLSKGLLQRVGVAYMNRGSAEDCDCLRGE